MREGKVQVRSLKAPSCWSEKGTGGVLEERSSPQGEEPSSPSRSRVERGGETPELMVEICEQFGGGWELLEGGRRWWGGGKVVEVGSDTSSFTQVSVVVTPGCYRSAVTR